MRTSTRILGLVVDNFMWARWFPGRPWPITWADLAAVVPEAWPVHVRHEPARVPAPRGLATRRPEEAGTTRF